MNSIFNYPVHVAGDCGILLPHGITQPITYKLELYEFVHLSVQELLAMMELSPKDTDTLIQTAQMMWRSSSFNMAKMFLYGLHFDSKSKDIKSLMQLLPIKEENQVTDPSIGNDKLLNILAKVIHFKSPFIPLNIHCL